MAPRTLDEVFIGDFDDDGGDGGDGTYSGERATSAVSAENPGLWERRLTRRGKALRGLVSAGLLTLMLLVLVGGADTVRMLIGQVLEPLTAVPIASASAAAPDLQPLRVDVPVRGGQLTSIKVRPVNGPGNFAYVCWITQLRQGLLGASSKLNLAVFSAEREEWVALPAPTASALTCDVVPDMTTPRRALLLVPHEELTGSGACALPDLYRTEDWGMTWDLVSWPASPTPPCQMQLALESGRLYALTDRSLLPERLLPRGAMGRFFVSLNTGRTWQAADVGLAGIRSFALVALRPGGRVLASGTTSDAPSATRLWQTRDSGAHWQSLGAIPGQQMEVYASSDPGATDDGGWGRLYAGGLTDASSPPGGQGIPRLVSDSSTTNWLPSILAPSDVSAPTWSNIQLPPDTFDGPVRLAGGLPGEAAVGPASALLFARAAFGTSGQVGVPKAEVLVWDGVSWLKSRYSIPSNLFFQGVSWYQGRMRIWLVPHVRLFVPLGQLVTLTISPG